MFSPCAAIGRWGIWQTYLQILAVLAINCALLSGTAMGGSGCYIVNTNAGALVTGI